MALALVALSEHAYHARIHLPLRAVVDDAFLGDGVHTWCCCAWRAYVVLLHMACHGAQAPLFSEPLNPVAQMAQNKVLVCVHMCVPDCGVCVHVRLRVCACCACCMRACVCTWPVPA